MPLRAIVLGEGELGNTIALLCRPLCSVPPLSIEDVSANGLYLFSVKLKVSSSSVSETDGAVGKF